MYESAVLTAPVSAPAPHTRQVAVAGTGGDGVARIRQWLAAATTAHGRQRFDPRPWNPAGVGSDAAPDLVVSWYGSADGVEAAAEPVLRGIAPGGTWVGLDPLPTAAALGLAKRARSAGITYVHAPLRRDPALLAEGTRTLVLAYQPPDEGGRSHTYSVLSALSSHVTWMGTLR